VLVSRQIRARPESKRSRGRAAEGMSLEKEPEDKSPLFARIVHPLEGPIRMPWMCPEDV